MCWIPFLCQSLLPYLMKCSQFFYAELEDPGNWNRTTQHLHPQLLSFKQHDKHITQSSINGKYVHS